MLVLLFMVSLTLTASTHEKNFFFEKNTNYPVAVGLETVAHLESVQSPYEKIDIYQTTRCGNMLVLDGAIQLTQWDNHAYHEMLVHVPLMAHPNPQRILIIGGGDGGTLTQVCKYPAQEIVLCDIDSQVINLSQKYFPEFAPSFTDPRVKIVIGNGAQFIKNFNDYFDIILVDASDPEGPASVLYTHDFYTDIYNALKVDGIAVAQGESPFFHQQLIIDWHARNQKIFPHVYYYYALVPTYPSGVIGFMYHAKSYTPLTLRNSSVCGYETAHYYTPALHKASFVLPKFMNN